MTNNLISIDKNVYEAMQAEIAETFGLTVEELEALHEDGTTLWQYAEEKGMTQEELADKTEVSTRTIQRIENGEIDPRAHTLQMIAKALEVDFSLFIEDESVPRIYIKDDDPLIEGAVYLGGGWIKTEYRNKNIR